MISYDIVMTGFAGWNGSRSIYMDERYKRKLLEIYPTSFLAPLEAEMTAGDEDFMKVFLEAEEQGLSIRAGEGGVYAALWKLLHQNRFSASFSQRAIPIRQETVEICETFSLDPYRLDSDGCFIWLSRGETGKLISMAEGIWGKGSAAIIGSAEKGTAIRRVDSEETAYLRRPEPDEILKLEPGI
ncbi:MAG TPA: AIR synthase [Candidatus Avilachnospira avicola]|nr:AIR synthase [Candidatus Avilachnospira avicola]